MGWGLLQGLGQGMQQVGSTMMQDYLDKMKQDRLQKYQTGENDKNRELEKRQIDQAQINSDRSYDLANKQADQSNINDDRNYTLNAAQLEQSKSQFEQTLGLQTKAQQDAREHDSRSLEIQQASLSLSAATALRNMEKIAQEIKLNEFEIEERQELNSLFKEIADPNTPPEQADSTYQRYLKLTKMDQDQRWTAFSFDEDDGMGGTIRRAGILNTRTGKTRGVNDMDEMPDPSSHNGEIIEDDEGKQYRSNGKEWLPL